MEFQEYAHAHHLEGGLEFFPIATEWLTERLAGVPAPNGCSSIGPGNSLALLPVPKRKKG